MRPRRAWLVGLLGPALLAGALVLLPDSAGPAVRAGDLDSACKASVRGTISERWVSVGERVAVMTRIALVCPTQRRPYHVAFVVDADAVRASGADGVLADDLRRLPESLALSHNRFVRAGIVAYGSDAWSGALCPVTNDAPAFEACARSAAQPEAREPSGGVGLDAGVRVAAKSLLLARGLVADRASDDPLRESIVAIERPGPCGADCDPERPACRPAREEARDVIAEGISLEVVCLADDCRASCLADLAERAYDMYAWDAMTGRQSGLAWQSELRVAEFALGEPLHPSLLVDPESIDYTAGQYNSSEHGITWRVLTRHRAHDPVLLSYAITTTVAGRFSVRLPDAGGVLVDTDGLAAQFDVPSHELLVSEGPLSHVHFPWAGKPELPPPPSKPLARP